MYSQNNLHKINNELLAHGVGGTSIASMHSVRTHLSSIPAKRRLYLWRYSLVRMATKGGGAPPPNTPDVRKKKFCYT